MKRCLSAAAAAVALAGGIAACSGPGDLVDAPVYTSVAELNEQAERVLVGEFESLTETVDEADLIHDGDLADGDGGLVLDLWAFRVDQVLTGPANLADQQITVTQVRQADSADRTFQTAEEGH